MSHEKKLTNSNRYLNPIQLTYTVDLTQALIIVILSYTVDTVKGIDQSEKRWVTFTV
jgi:hypothetical protein